MTFKQMQDQAAAASGRKDAGFQSIIKSEINRSRRSVFRATRGEPDLSVSLPLTVGLEEYELPGTVGYVTRVVGGDGRRIDVLNEAFFQEQYAQLQAEQALPWIVRPFGYGEDRALILKFWPLPLEAETVTIYGSQRPAWLTGDTEESEFDAEFDRAAMLDVIAYLQVLNADELATRTEGMADRRLSRLVQTAKDADGAGRLHGFANDPLVAVFRED